MKIDTLKGVPKQQSGYGVDDMDMSEPETALTTPTGSQTDLFLRRLSSCSSSLSSNSYTTSKSQNQQKVQPKRKSNHTEILEKKVHLLEKQIRHHIERETELKSQVALLEQKNAYPSDSYKLTLSRVSKHINRFLVSYDKRTKKHADDSIWKENNTDWSGYELPALFDSEIPMKDVPVHIETEKNTIAQDIVQLKTIIHQFSDQVSHMNDDHPSLKKRTLWFCSDLKRVVDSTWSHTFIVDNDADRCNTEKERVVQLLNALQRSLQRNKILQKNHAIEINQYKHRLHSMMQELAQSRALMKKQLNENNSKKRSHQSLEEMDTFHAPCQKLLKDTCTMFEAQIKMLEGSLSNCQEERDEFETTLEMVRREMETMLEELEDTRQQRVRYKTQANRLRAGIEAIQKRKKQRLDNDNDEDDDDSDEQNESLRLLYNEAERQAVDLERECKRQTLTLNSVRQELKMMEEKYHTVKVEKTKDLKELEIENNKIKRQVEALELEKSALYQREELQQQQKEQKIHEKQNNKKERNLEYDEIEENDLDYYLLQIAFEAAQADTIAQRSRITHLEKECLLTKRFEETLQELHSIFKKELEKEDVQVNQLIKQMKAEQTLWQDNKSREFQKKYDTNTVQATREIRLLAIQLSDSEDEITQLQNRHMNELTLLKKEYTVEAEKKIQRLVTRHKSKEEDFIKENEALFQQIQTLQDESLVLYGRNMIMAHELGKFT
ncbi:hypothetical protein K501DRAFT_201051 [Backusella circina FSU 941]|nr:hypothetical protein K501DRAFT_201051 [Backusella circina FSU 941]